MGYRNELVATPAVEGGGGDAAKRLPQLGDVRIAAPCGAAWDAMAPVGGDGRVRHCTGCDKHVYNLSEMTRDEAQSLVAATEGNLCARFYRRADGTVMTRDCAVGVTRRRKLRVIAAAGAALMATGAAAAMFGGSEPAERMAPPQSVLEIQLPVAPPPAEPVLTVPPVRVGPIAMGVVAIRPAPPPVTPTKPATPAKSKHATSK
jgi:hypothetical protein|nr:hypothetical protein [Kofleriaceae bacterium]